MEDWSNASCCGYVIRALESLEKSPEEIHEIINQLRAEFDWLMVEEAEQKYMKSPY